MTAKIEWYREVLELEPNSKVFLPLARLLAEDGQSEEAIGILEEGVKRHPEFLEARLCLIEMLHRNNYVDQCNAQIGHLSKLFASYAGFWEAWAACLASDQGNEDTASIIRFLAAHFVSGPIKLHDVLNRGLDAMLKDGSATPHQAAQIAMATAQSTAREHFAINTADMLADLDAELGSMNPHEAIVPPAEEAALPDDNEAAPHEELELPEEEVSPDIAAGEGVEPEEELALPEDSGDTPPAVEALDAEGPVETAPEGLDLPVEEISPDVMGAEAVAPVDEELALPEDDAVPPIAEAEAVEESVVAASEDIELPEEEVSPDIAAEEGIEPEEELALPEDSGGTPPAVETEPVDEAAIAAAEEPEPSGEEIAPDVAVAEALVSESEELALPEDDAMSAVAEADPVDEAALAASEGADLPEEGISPDVMGMEAVASADEELALPEDDDPVPPAVEAEPVAEIAQECEGALGDDGLPEMPEPEQAPDAVARAEANLLAGMEMPSMDMAVNAPVETESMDDEFGEEETFSLRTRSMAEVLAEQGDLQGALDIYHELAAAATSADEAEDINRRIATLSGRLNIANASAGTAVDAMAAARSKEQLLGMLQTLAERVEARAQG